MFAGFLELAAMWVRVTRRASRKFHVLESRRPAGHFRFVTFFASYLDMQSRERVARLGVIELFCRFPIAGVVAAHAVFAELPFVVVLMATDACLRQSHVCFRQILVLDQTAFRRRNILRRVALHAFHLNVLSVQYVSGQLVIELFDRNFPMN